MITDENKTNVDNEIYKVTCLEDDERTKFMFSSFPTDKSINPKHWESKLQFWTSEITKSCRVFGDICFTYEKLCDRFQDCMKRSPSGLATVISELYINQQIVRYDALTNLFDETWTKWSFRLANRSLFWVWSKVWSGPYNQDTTFIVKELLEEFSTALLHEHYKKVKYEKTDNIVPWSVLKSLYKINKQNISEENLTCLIGFLKSKGKCRVGIAENGEKIIKFKSRVLDSVEAVSETDFQIVRLKKTLARLCIENSNTEREINKLHSVAQNCLRMKDSAQAKKILSQKQKLTKQLVMKQDAVSSLKNHLNMIQEAETTKMITDAFDSSSTILSDAYRKEGLTIEHVDEIMMKNEEANDMVAGIEDALAAGVQRFEDDVNLDELEKELQELQVDEEELVLPLVPDHSLPIQEPEKSPTRDQAKKRLLCAQ